MPGLTDIPQDKMEEAMQKACDDQVSLLEKAKAKEVAKFIVDNYGDALRRLSKT